MSVKTGFAVLIAALGVLTAAAAIASDGDPLITILPTVLVGLLYVTARVPLRYAVLPLCFLALTLENPADVPAEGLWRSPLYGVGSALLTHLNLTFPGQRWLVFSGLDLVLVYLFSIALVRWIRGSGPDRGKAIGSPPMRASALLCLLGAAWMWVWGMARGGADVASSLWQVQRVVYLPVVYLLVEMALRGAADRVAFGRILILAASTKALLAIYLHATLVPRPGAATIEYATTHADSMLFASAFCFVVAWAFERWDARMAVRAAALLSLFAAGMIANHRRLAWVEVGAGLVPVVALSARTRIKRSLGRALVLLSPVAAAYVALGWSATGGFFGPVQLVRSVIDSKADASTEWRDWENYDLFFTLRQGPVLGTGYGHGYIEAVKLPQISQFYALYRHIPHNSILGLWAYGGIVGFSLLWCMIVVGLYLAARSARFASTPADRIAAITVSVVIVVYVIHCYGDMGLGTWTAVFTVGPALAVVSRLAVETRAWPSVARRSTPPLDEVVVVVPVRADCRASAGRSAA